MNQDTFVITAGSSDTIQLDLDFSNLELNSITLDSMGAQPTISISADDSWQSLSLGSGSGVWSMTDGITTNSSKIQLTGEDADIEINGESVVGMLREIRDRLNIMQVSEKLEAEWDELRELRQLYEAKLVECREKSRAWDALKSMPPPKPY
jgi:hypothetical protein